MAHIDAAAREVRETFAVETPAVDPRQALMTVRRRVAAGDVPARDRWMGMRWHPARFLGSAGAMATLAGAVVLTPIGGWAHNFFTIFQPQQIQAVSVTTDQLRSLPDLNRFGTVSAPKSAPMHTYASAAAAAAAAGMSVPVPATLPAGVASSVKYHVMPGATGSFTFSAAKATAWAKASGKALPPMPAHVDGSTLRVTLNSTEVAIYQASGDAMPGLVIGEMRAPLATSTGASVRELENYVLGLPGVSPQLASELRAVNDPTSTLPLLIPVDRAHSHTVLVQGVHGVAVGDNTGVGTAVLWEKRGVVYGVGGTISESTALDVANHLR